MRTIFLLNISLFVAWNSYSKGLNDTILVLAGKSITSSVAPAHILELERLNKANYKKPVGTNKYAVFSFSIDPDVPSSTLLVFSGLSNGKKIVIPDLNGDWDFTNDTAYEYEIAKSKRRLMLDSVKPLRFNYVYTKSQNRFRYFLDLKILPYEPLRYSAVSDEELLQIYVTWNDERRAKFELDGKVFELGLNNAVFPGIDYRNCDINIRLVEMDSIVPLDPVLRPGENFSLGTKSARVNGVSFFGDTVRLAITTKGSVLGIREGDYISPEVLKELKGELSDGPFSHDGYLLLDFWGTLCGPCIESIPELVGIYRLYRKTNQLQLFSCAVESDQNLSAHSKIVKQFGMNWDHVIELRNAEGCVRSYARLFKIEKFPTTLLLDSNGRIIVRGSGLYAIDKLRDQLKKYIR